MNKWREKLFSLFDELPDNAHDFWEWLVDSPGAVIVCSAVGVIAGIYVGIVHVRFVGGVLLSCAIGVIAGPLALLLLVLAWQLLKFIGKVLFFTVLAIAVGWILVWIFRAISFVLRISW